MNRETTDLTLFVHRTEEDIARWDRERIVEALVRETGIGREVAEEISREVERQIFSSGISLLTSQLIRELVDAKLIERGMEEAVRRHARLGFPLFDVENLLLHPNREQASVPHGPEGTNMILAGGIKRDYALYHVFSRAVSDAHARGDIHLHDLGFIDRIVSVHQSLTMLKQRGLDLPPTLTVARPARHAEVLLAHLVRLSTMMRSYVSGTVSWEALNVSFAPYTAPMSDRELAQFAQMFVYEFSQLASATGGQAMCTDIHLYWHVPAEMAHRPMIGPGGKETGKACGEYVAEARRLARAFIKVYLDGDGEGKPFVFPRPVFHLAGDFADEAYREFVFDLGELAMEKGNPCFVFDRGEGHDASFPASRRFVLHNCSINLPRLGYQAQGDEVSLMKNLHAIVELVVKAHHEKRQFIDRLLSYGEEGPLMFLGQRAAEGTYFDLNQALCLVGIIGIDELMRIHWGDAEEMSEKRRRFALALVRRLGEELRAEGRRHDLRILLGQLPAEATSHRFARLDLRYYSPPAGRVVRGDLAGGGIYYSDSGLLGPDTKIDAWDRVRGEGELQQLMPGGGTVYLWLGNERVPVAEVVEFLHRVAKETSCRELALAPDFTLCRTCGQASRGRWETCPHCRASAVDGMSIITQYFSRVSWWNKGKQAELRDRYRYASHLL